MKALKRDSKDLNLKMEVEEKMGYNLLNYTRIRRNIISMIVYMEEKSWDVFLSHLQILSVKQKIDDKQIKI